MKSQWVQSVQVRGLTALLPSWPTALRILPFKVRPHSVLLYPHAGFIPLSPGGSLGAPKSPFYKLPPASQAVISAGNFQAGSFPRTVKRNSSWHAFILRFVWRSSYTFRFAQLNYGQGSKVEQHTAGTDRQTEGESSPVLEKRNFRMSAGEILIVL